MAMDYDVQRLELGDVVLIELDDPTGPVEAKVVREIERTDTTASWAGAGWPRRTRFQYVAAATRRLSTM